MKLDLTNKQTENLQDREENPGQNSHVRAELLSQVSHDIRTPLNAVMGFTDLAKKANSLEEVKQEYLPKIETAGNHILMILNDVLEMNDLTNGKVAFRKAPYDITVLIQNILTILQLRIQEKKLTMETNIQVTDKWVYCDEGRVMRVLMNLLTNAVKFTPAGGTVTLEIEQLTSEKPGYGTYLARIADTGIGMSEEFLPRVFNAFAKEQYASVSQMEGTGLGLAIVKGILDACGASITVESTPKVGTTFEIRVQLPLVEKQVSEEIQILDKTTTERMMSPGELKECFTGKRVLLVEDNEFNRLITEVVLEEQGFLVESAEDGQTAVHMVKDAPAEDYYDIILMDVQLPVMNGYEATRAIRSLEGARSQIKILAVTANAFESDKRNARKAGMDGHVSKPLHPDVLYRALLGATGKWER